MVSTRGLKYKFTVGERVLCYEPDPTKAKVLYDSKVNCIRYFSEKYAKKQLKSTSKFQVIEIVEEKDKKGRRTVEYLIHFQGYIVKLLFISSNCRSKIIIV